MVHKPKHKVHSFRGLLADGGQDEINLERSNLNLAYRIVKFEIMPDSVAATRNSVVSIWREEQTSIVQSTNFTDTDLLACAIWYNQLYEVDNAVIFDNTLFSRNIYVGHHNSEGTDLINYYIELEEVPVGAATLMQLKLGVARKLSLSESPPDA